jgi:hypothetical protein
MSSGSNSDAQGNPARAVAKGGRAWSSLSARLALWYTVVILASFVTAAAVFAVRAQGSLQRDSARSAEGALERYRQALESGGTAALQSMFDCSPGPRAAVRLTDERDVELFVVSSDEASRHAAATSNDGMQLNALPEWHVAATEVSQNRRLSVALHDERGSNCGVSFGRRPSSSSLPD